MPGIKVAISPAFNKLIPSGITYIVAEGGTITRDGDYLVHEFPAGTFNFNVLSNNGGYSLDMLGAAAGAAGGGTNNGGAGGGGGGDVLEVSFIPTVRSYALTVGAGGLTQGVESGLNGGNTTFETESGTETLLGGGGGGSGNNTVEGDGIPGGSGGGMGFNRAGVTGIATGLGNNGGSTNNDGGGGGGGIGSIGQNCTSAIGGNGGTGLASSISGTLKYYGCGGGGGSFLNATPGLGGNSTGGNGGYVSGGIQPPTNPVANSGSGGGGSGNDATGTVKTGTNGADGVLYVRYLFPSLFTSFNYETVLSNA